MAIAYVATHMYGNKIAVLMYCLEKATGAPVLQVLTGSEAGEIATLNVDDSTGLDEFVVSSNASPEPPMAAGRILYGQSPVRQPFPFPTKDGQEYVILAPLAVVGAPTITVALLCRLVNNPQQGPVVLFLTGGGTATPAIAF